MCTSRSSTNFKVPPIYEALGLAAMVELVQAAKAWTEAHKLSLFMISTVLAELGGGVDVALEHSHAVVFMLGPPKAYDGAPSTAFRLETMGYYHRDKLKGGPVEAQWSTAVVAHHEASARCYRDSSNVAGLVPVTFCLRGSPVAPHTSFPVCRPRVPGGRVVDERTKTTLRALPGLVTSMVNKGLVFRAPKDPDQIVPDTGRLVRGRKGWTWTPPEYVLAMGLAGFLWFCESRYGDSGPTESFTAYHQLWPYNLVPDGA